MTRVTRLIAVAGSSLAVAATLAVGAHAGEHADHRAGAVAVAASVPLNATRGPLAAASARPHRWVDARVGVGIAIAFVLLLVRTPSGRAGAAARSTPCPSPTGEPA